MEDISFLPDKPKTNLDFLPDKSEDLSFLPDQKNPLTKTINFLKPQPGISGGDIVKQFGIGFANEAALGFPLFALEKGVSPEARKALESDAPAERIARGVGSTAGFALGLPGKVFVKGGQLGVKALKVATKATKLGRFTKAATIGAAGFGAYETLKAPEKDFSEKIATVPMATVIGAGLGIGGETLNPIVKNALSKLFSKKVITQPIIEKTLKTETQKLLPYKPIIETKNLGVLAEGNANMMLENVNQQIQNRMSLLPILRRRGLVNEVVDTERQLKSLFDIQKGLFKNLQKSAEIPTAFQKASEKVTLEYGFKIKIPSNEVVAIKSNQDFIVKQVGKDIPQVALDEVANVRKNRFMNNLMTSSTREYLKGTGERGAKIVTTLDGITNKSEVRSGQAIADYLKIRKGLSKQELSNFVDVAEGRANPLNNKVENLLSWWHKQGEQIISEGQQLGMNVKRIKVGNKLIPEIVDLKPRDNYFPHITIPTNAPSNVVNETLSSAVKRGEFKNIEHAKAVWNSYKRYVDSGERGEKIFQYFVDTGQAQNTTEAKRIFNLFVRKVRQRRFGNLERAREVNLPFYDVNPDRSLVRYLNGAYHRLEEIKHLGLKDEIFNQLKHDFVINGGDETVINEVFDRFVGRELSRNAFGFINTAGQEKIKSFQTITKLGLSAIPNSTQSINTAIYTGTRNTAIGLQKAFTEGGKDWAIRTGAILDSTLNDAMQGATGGIGGFAKKFLKTVGFTATERMNRVIAANAGKEYAIQLSKKLFIDPTNRITKRGLMELGLNPQQILNRGNITVEELLLASQRVVNKTQFRSGVLDLPLFFTSPEGKIMMQFKTFAFNQAKFMKDAVLLEAMRGNFRPLITALTLMPVLGEGVKDIKSIMTGKSRDKEGIERIAENISAVGSLGIFMDLWQSAAIGKATDFLIGPTGSEIGGLLNSIAQLVQGKPKPMARQTLKQIPIGGQFLKNVLVPTKEK